VKKAFRIIGKFLLELLIIPLLLLILLMAVCVFPFDYIRYKKTQFCKDTGVKYFFASSFTGYVKLYNAVKREKFPIEYHIYNDEIGAGYFVYGDTLVIEYLEPYVDEKDNKWYAECEDEHIELNIAVERCIKECNEFFKEEKCKNALVLTALDGDACLQYEQYELVPVQKGDFGTALKRYLENK